ncbi:MAG: hypothetical protein L0206_19320 [Actinobacteria bacterium]|nr:hypothetical protein [Actinomycetota bacterium]
MSASPSSVSEGGKVGVTVKRDGAAGPSSVHVSTADISARVGSDYERLDQEVEFESQTSLSFTIAIADDKAGEGSETFRIHLSRPDGCPSARDRYVTGADAIVTIRSSDGGPAAAPAPKPTAKPTTRPGGTSVPLPTRAGSRASPSTSDAAESPLFSDTPFPNETLRPDVARPREGGGGASGTTIALAALGLLAAGSVVGIGYLRYRGRAS